MMIYLNPTHVAEEYEQRLQEFARDARREGVPRELVMRRRLGRLIIGLGELVHGERVPTVNETADLRTATN